MLEIDGHRLTQSLAIINYLDLRYPEPAADPGDRRPSARMSSRWRWRSPATSTRSTICACSNISRTSSAIRRTRSTPGTRTGSAKGLPALEAMAAPRAGQVPVRRCADRRRRLPGAAALQCAAVQRAARRLSDVAARRRECQQARGVRRRASRPAGGAGMNRVDSINRGMSDMKPLEVGRDPADARTRSATRNGRSASISPPPTGWSRITAGTTSSSPICRRAFRGPSIISCSTPTI